MEYSILQCIHSVDSIHQTPANQAMYITHLTKDVILPWSDPLILQYHVNRECIEEYKVTNQYTKHKTWNLIRILCGTQVCIHYNPWRNTNECSDNKRQPIYLTL